MRETVLITGASSGFGEAMARLYAQKGYNLILIARREDRLEKLKNEFDAQIVKLDVSNSQDVQDKLSSLDVDILINNAGLVLGLKNSWENTSAEMDRMIDTNIKGVLNVTRACLPNILKRQKGHIINISSISGYETYAGGAIYCATKHAVRALTDALRKELVSTPIRVSMVSPGMAKTEFSEVRFYGDKKKADEVYSDIIPLSADDVAETVYFITSRPPHVNIGDIILYPTNQASVSVVHRSKGVI